MSLEEFAIRRVRNGRGKGTGRAGRRNSGRASVSDELHQAQEQSVRRSIVAHGQVTRGYPGQLVVRVIVSCVCVSCINNELGTSTRDCV